MKNPKSLLSAEEIKVIETKGLPMGLPSDLVTAGSDGSIIFSVKGIATYQHAISFYRHPGKLSDIKNLRDFKKFLFLIQALVVKALKKKLEVKYLEGRTDKSCKAVVEAVLYGTPQQVLDTLTRSAEVGPEVVLLPIKKYG